MVWCRDGPLRYRFINRSLGDGRSFSSSGRRRFCSWERCFGSGLFDGLDSCFGSRFHHGFNRSRLFGRRAGNGGFDRGFQRFSPDLAFWLGWLCGLRWLGFQFVTPRRMCWACVSLRRASVQAYRRKNRRFPKSGMVIGSLVTTWKPADHTRHCSMPCKKMSFGKSMPINTILFSRFSSARHSGPRSLPINWCTP